MAAVPDIEWTDDELRAAAAWLHQRANEGSIGNAFEQCEAKHAGVAYTELCMAMRAKPARTNKHWISLGWIVIWLVLAEVNAVGMEGLMSCYGVISKLLIVAAGVHLAVGFNALRERIRWSDRQMNLRIRAETESSKRARA